jgi:ribosomal protein S27E
MSYESRRKKRQHKRVDAKVRKQRSASTASRWFLIMAKRPGRCSVCRRRFDPGAEVVYRHADREVRCLACGERKQDSKGFRLSVKWERAKATQQKTATRSGLSGNSPEPATKSGSLKP